MDKTCFGCALPVMHHIVCMSLLHMFMDVYLLSPCLYIIYVWNTLALTKAIRQILGHQLFWSGVFFKIAMHKESHDCQPFAVHINNLLYMYDGEYAMRAKKNKQDTHMKVWEKNPNALGNSWL